MSCALVRWPARTAARTASRVRATAGDSIGSRPSDSGSLAAIVAAGVALASTLLAIRMPRHVTAADADTGDIDARAVMDLAAAA